MKRGPKTEPMIEGVRARTVSLDDVTTQMLEALGGGNLSRGIRVSARYAYDCYQRGHFSPDRTIAARAAPSLAPNAPKAPRPPGASRA